MNLLSDCMSLYDKPGNEDVAYDILDKLIAKDYKGAAGLMTSYSKQFGTNDTASREAIADIVRKINGDPSKLWVALGYIEAPVCLSSR